jgi:hypothetical protein
MQSMAQADRKTAAALSMIYKYTPPRINNAGVVIPLFLFAAAAVCMLFGAAGIGYRLILQLTAVVCAVSGIAINARYRLCTFTYIIETQDSGDWSLTVVRTRGRHSRTAAVIPLSTVIAAEKGWTHSEAKKKYYEIKQCCNFCANLFARDSWLIVCTLGGDTTSVIIEPDERIIVFLKKFISVIDK